MGESELNHKNLAVQALDPVTQDTLTSFYMTQLSIAHSLIAITDELSNIHDRLYEIAERS